jgi:pimeloyl-ACP methyl ester carboxylesterase
MVPMIDSTPPLVSSRPMPRVRRRILFYLPGYDPGADRRYRTLFVRELRRYTKRFKIVRPQLSRETVSEDRLVQAWTIKAGEADQETETTYEVLLWDDLVRRDMGRPLLVGAFLNALALLHVAATGTLFRLCRASWKCGGVILYPFVMTLLLPGAVLVLAALSYTLLSVGLGMPAWLTLTLGTAAGLVGLQRMAPWLERAFLWQLMNDWVFNWQHANGRRPDYMARLDAFTNHVQSRIGGMEVDEIMLVGHSTGAVTAVELAARLLARDDALGRDGPALSLLTLGSSLPIVAMQPGARSTRAEIEGLIVSPRLVWVDYQAPQDWMNFPRFNPTRDLRLQVPAAQVANPIIRSAKFREIIDPTTYREIKARPFRMHFQYLMANDFAGAYDILALTLGPQCLRDRVLSGNASPLGAVETEPSREQRVAQPAPYDNDCRLT